MNMIEVIDQLKDILLKLHAYTINKNIQDRSHEEIMQNKITTLENKVNQLEMRLTNVENRQ